MLSLWSPCNALQRCYYALTLKWPPRGLWHLLPSLGTILKTVELFKGGVWTEEAVTVSVFCQMPCEQSLPYTSLS